ncbi:MAG: ATP synthase F0 subunit B [Myxococcota bacterium]|nr:ATP synthase F0 subunit B [Myxococcota bacterium]
MEIMPNPVMTALSAIPFLVTILGLYFIIFKPMLQYLDERLEAMEGGAEEAKGLEARIVELSTDYEQKLKAARGQIIELRSRMRAEAEAEVDARLAAARAEADAEVEAARASIQAEADAARAGLEDTARALAGNIAGQVLGKTAAVG